MNIHLLMPFSRHHLWDKLIEDYRPMGVVLHPLVYDDEPLPKCGEDWLIPFTSARTSGFNQSELLNRFIELAYIDDDDYYVSVSDDDMYEPRVFDKIREMDDPVVVISMKRGQNIPAGAYPAYPTFTLCAVPQNVFVGGIGGEQIFMKGSVLKTIRFDELNPSVADGILAVELKGRYPIRYEPDLYALFNYYEPGRWEERQKMLSIVIPVFNQHSLLADCLEAVRANTKDYEIIIVDNGSDPPIEWHDIDKLLDIPPEKRTIIRNPSNLGFPKAVNLGVGVARGEAVIVLNDDVIVSPHWAERLERHLDTFSVASPMTNYCAGLQQEAILPGYSNETEMWAEAEKWGKEHEGEAREVNFVIGFCMAFKKSLFDEIGEFDDSLWPCSGEEIDWCFRAREKGRRIGIARDTYVHHIGSQTFAEMERAGQIKYFEVINKNDTHLGEKWGWDFWHKQTGEPPKRLVRLNLGCGPYLLKYFVNIDKSESIEPDIVADALDLPYELGTVDEIYCGHLLEHLTFEEGQRALKYWHSLLKDGGKIGITVPNFDVIAASYLKDPTPEAMKELNDYFIYSYVQDSLHKYCYSEDLLKESMEAAGFEKLKKLPEDHRFFVENVPWQVGFQGTKNPERKKDADK
jgi:GT2 family glycosyltransferase/predicted SAM-dependent methyltransferase